MQLSAGTNVPPTVGPPREHLAVHTASNRHKHTGVILMKTWLDHNALQQPKEETNHSVLVYL